MPNICAFTDIIKATVVLGTLRRMGAMQSNIAGQRAALQAFQRRSKNSVLEKNRKHSKAPVDAWKELFHWNKKYWHEQWGFEKTELLIS